MGTDLLDKLELRSAQPMIHRIGRIVVGGIAGILATTYAEKLYDVSLKAYQQKQSI